MNFLPWIIFGVVAGVLATVLETNPKDRGLLGAVILGILGSMTGGMVADLLLAQEVTISSGMVTLVAIVGAMGLLFIGRLFKEVPST